jgi:hypothetical protein
MINGIANVEMNGGIYGSGSKKEICWRRKITSKSICLKYETSAEMAKMTFIFEYCHFVPPKANHLCFICDEPDIEIPLILFLLKIRAIKVHSMLRLNLC